MYGDQLEGDGIFLDPKRGQRMILLIVFILLLIVRYLNNNHWRDSLFEAVI